jgi:hypothetical protein
MDTTWPVLRLYLIVILMTVPHNTAIPLAFAFGPAEDCTLYDIFADILEKRFGVLLSEFILDSDHGPGLRKFARDHEAMRCFCLVHFLATLEDRTFGHFVAYPVKAYPVEECKLLRRAYRSQVHEAIRRFPLTGLKRARGEFATADLGIIFRPGKQTPSIWIINRARWEQVSNIFKFQDCLPTTTNFLEDRNDHCNEDTPRRNKFWASFFGLR